MAASHNILSVADALKQSGMDTRQAHTCATQMHLIANAKDAVTHAEMEAMFWCFFAGTLAFTGLLATIVVTAIRYLPPAAGG